MSHDQVLSLLRREANQMSGYGMDFECPQCDGSGLIGGFAGQRSIIQSAAEVPMTVADRKKFLAALKKNLGAADPPRKVRTLEQRIADAKAYADSGGKRKPKKVVKKYTEAEVDALVTSYIGEHKRA